MSFSGMLGGGGVSENTLRPEPSTHCHWAAAALQTKLANKANKTLRQTETGVMKTVMRAV